MNPFKRLSTGVAAQFNALIDQIENHEAVAEGVIRSVENAAAKAKVQLKRVQYDSNKLKTRLNQLEKDKDLWKARIRKVHSIDEKRAIECVRRLKRVENEIVEAEAEYKRQLELKKQLTEDVALIDDKLQALKRKKNVFATRQSRADALEGLHPESASLMSELEGVFDRWDTKITRQEIKADCGGTPTDELEEQFKTEEEEAELKSYLQEIIDDQ